MEGRATFTMVVSSTIINTPAQRTYSAHQRLRASSNMKTSLRNSDQADDCRFTSARIDICREIVSPDTGPLETIYLCGADEIVLVQAADGVGLVADACVTPATLDVGMVV